jgi:hypothetical protein
MLKTAFYDAIRRTHSSGWFSQLIRGETSVENYHSVIPPAAAQAKHAESSQNHHQGLTNYHLKDCRQVRPLI